MPRAQFTSIMPGFSVRSMIDAIDFYKNQLGFEVSFRNGEVFTIVSRAGAEISLGLDRSGKRIGTGSCYLKMKGVEALYREFVEKGIQITHPLKTEEYHMREFQIADPDGNTINFGEPTTSGKKLAPPLP